jgi:hypothetical protein
MVFIGLRALKIVGPGGAWKQAAVIHFNPHFIKTINEKNMILTLDDGTEYRIDDESLQIFLAAMYGEQKIRGDKLEE